jgi:competence protein ComEC
VLTFLPLLTLLPPRPVAGTAAITVLDVGQGLAIHVQTATHDLLFDAGPAYSSDADSGNRIIAPYLRAHGGCAGSMSMVISHGDKDHEGGAASVLAALPVTVLKSSLPFEHRAVGAAGAARNLCVTGMHGSGMGSRFKVLHPGAQTLSRKINDLSCVLRVTAGGQGDAAHLGYRGGVGTGTAGSTNRVRLAASVMTAPHHGSQALRRRPSSSPPSQRVTWSFQSAIATASATRSRTSLERYRAKRALRLHRTDAHGAIGVAISDGRCRFRHERELRRRYWHAVREIIAPVPARR